MRKSSSAFTYTLTIDVRCRTCVMPWYIAKDLREWGHVPDDGDIAEAIAQHVEHRCSGCIEGCSVEEEDDHFHIFLATDDDSSGVALQTDGSE